MAEVKKEIKTEVTNVRFSKLQKARLFKLAGERQWSISHIVQFIIDQYCENLFLKDSEEFK